MFAALPLLALPVIAYTLMAVIVGAQDAMTIKLFTIHMPTGGDWGVALGDLLLATSLVVLFIELLKSTASRRLAIINHSLSVILFIVCLIEFLLAPGFATSTFFLITLMVLLDVLAGFLVTIVSARRDVDDDGTRSRL